MLQGLLTDSVWFDHENDDLSTCVMNIRVKRNAVVYFFKGKLPPPRPVPIP